MGKLVNETMEETMSIRHSVECTRTEADAFRTEVKAFLDSENLQYHRIIALTAYEGEVRVYTGNTVMRPRRRSGRKFVSGDGNTSTYLITKGQIEELEYTSTFRDEWYNPEYQDEEKAALRKLLSHQYAF